MNKKTLKDKLPYAGFGVLINAMAKKAGFTLVMAEGIHSLGCLICCLCLKIAKD